MKIPIKCDQCGEELEVESGSLGEKVSDYVFHWGCGQLTKTGLIAQDYVRGTRIVLKEKIINE